MYKTTTTLEQEDHQRVENDNKTNNNNSGTAAEVKKKKNDLLDDLQDLLERIPLKTEMVSSPTVDQETPKVAPKEEDSSSRKGK